jgi:integrase
MEPSPKSRRIPGRDLQTDWETVPAREIRGAQCVSAIRENDGRQDSQQKAKPGADLLELPAYSGCRIAEANALTWADVDFEKKTLTVAGGKGGTKNYECRIIPLAGGRASIARRVRQHLYDLPVLHDIGGGLCVDPKVE